MYCVLRFQSTFHLSSEVNILYHPVVEILFRDFSIVVSINAIKLLLKFIPGAETVQLLFLVIRLLKLVFLSTHDRGLHQLL